jgi:hypothetical protein
MNALIALVALGFAENNIPVSWTPAWQNDYRQAKLQASEFGKPLAVLIGSGKKGWDSVAQGSIDENIARLLNTKYVCVYIDTDTASGKKLAEAFEVKEKGLVISDRAGSTQAFYHNGDLSQNTLTKALEKYSDANRVALSTETVLEVDPKPVPAPQPTYYPGGIRYYGTVPGSTCPNCR